MHASDIFAAELPDSTTLDFFDMVEAPCPVLLSNPPYSQATALLEHAFAIGFRVVIFLLTTNYLHTGDRFERVHKRGTSHPCVSPGRAAAGHARRRPSPAQKASQPQVHSWFVFRPRPFWARDHHSCVAAPPDERMPWAESDEPPCSLRLASQD